jgi:molybdate transport system substrate-binding protein
MMTTKGGVDMMRWMRLVCLSLLWLWGGATAAAETKPAVTLLVSAASDLVFAFQELGALFEQTTGTKVVFNFGSTGHLAQQIERGAPVDVFAAANIAFVDLLEQQGLILPDTKAAYARGRLTLWTRADSPLRLSHIGDLTGPEVRRVAIANPAHAPYGVAAREALQTAGLWEQLQPKLILGESIQQAFQYAATGNVDTALVALSLSIRQEGRWVLIPEALHRPLVQALAVLKHTRHETPARQFAAFINSPQGQPIMHKYGFVLPAEQTRP